MKRQEMIRYLELRTEECGYEKAVLSRVHSRLKAFQDEDMDHLIRISEQAFRNWCEESEDEGRV